MKPSKQSKSLIDIVRPKQEIRYAVIEIPKTLNRFVVLPSINEKKYVIFR